MAFDPSAPGTPMPNPVEVIGLRYARAPLARGRSTDVAHLGRLDARTHRRSRVGVADDLCREPPEQRNEGPDAEHGAKCTEAGDAIDTARGEASREHGCHERHTDGRGNLTLCVEDRGRAAG